MDAHAPSYRVVKTVAQKEGISPAELSPPLFNVIDPDALDTLVQAGTESSAGEMAIEFTYLNYAVRIENGPAVSISVQDADTPIDTSESVREH